MICHASGKTGFASKHEAREFLRDLQHKPLKVLTNFQRTGKMPHRCYRCPSCGAWHVTSMDKLEVAPA